MTFTKHTTLLLRPILSFIRTLRLNANLPNICRMSAKNCAVGLAVMSSVLLMFLSSLNAGLNAGQLPAFWDNQRLSKPDLSQLMRLRFLTSTDFAPFNFIDKNGQLSGYNIDLTRAICRELALEQICQIEAKPWDELVPSLQADTADALIAGLFPTKEQRENLSFSGAYLSLPARFAARAQVTSAQVTSAQVTRNQVADKDSPDFTAPLPLAEKEVGVVAGSIHEKLLHSYYPQAKITTYPDLHALYDALRADEIQLLFADAMTVALWMNSNDAKDCCRFVGGAYPAPQFLSSGMTIAVRKQDTILAEAFNYALQSLERKGVLNDLYLRYFPISFY